MLQRLGDGVSPYPRSVVVNEVRLALERTRRGMLEDPAAGLVNELDGMVLKALEAWTEPSLRKVINATGVILHTNLGRAPLGTWKPIDGYSNLEYDLQQGRRGKRDSHIQPLLEALLHRPAIAVNNGAAATFLVLHELARGADVIISRGELIEIGEGFRIPEILKSSNASLVEIGTTNRTTIDDYRNAITPETRLLMRVHPSNFRITGFTARPGLPELVALGREHGIPVYEDLGSGNLLDLRPFGIDEPLVQDSIKAGANLISFSGDKLMGGPQAGIVAGDAELILRIRRNPLFRALRLDKLISQSLESKLRGILLEDWDSIPALAMIRMTVEEIGRRARQLFPNLELISGESVIGGGSTPDQTLPTMLAVVAGADPVKAEEILRRGNPPIIARIRDGKLVLDLRTVFPEEESQLSQSVEALPQFVR